MTEPLIDIEELVAVFWDANSDPGQNVYEAVLTYLRSVLTPEALTTTEVSDEADGVSPAERERWTQTLTGTDLHRRIFGEDQ